MIYDLRFFVLLLFVMIILKWYHYKHQIVKEKRYQIMLSYDLNARKYGKENRFIYKYLYECIREDIIKGNLKPDEKLPGKRSLADHLGISVNSVMNAYSLLLTEGFIYSEEKRGYFVQPLNYVTMPKKSQPLIEEDEDLTDPDYLIDFRANRVSLHLFPTTVWGKYMREALALSGDLLFQTIPYKGLYELRQAIANDLLKTRNMQVDPAQIIIGAGTEYLYNRLLVLLKGYGSFASADPGYRRFERIAQNYDVTWKYISTDESNIRIEELEKSGASIVHVSPANLFPVGYAMPIKRRIELFNWVNEKRGRFIIEDDYDSEFRYDSAFIMPLFAEDVSNKVIYMNTFSKTLVPSIRISYMVLPPKLMKKYEENLSFYSCSVSSFEQYALARFISEGHYERHLLKLINYYRKIRQMTLTRFKQSRLSAISKIEEYNAGTHFLIRIRTDKTDAEVKRIGNEKGLHISLYSAYRADQKREKEDECCLVINYAGITEDNIDEVIRRMEDIFV